MLFFNPLHISAIIYLYFSNAEFREQNFSIWQIQLDWYCLSFSFDLSHTKDTPTEEKRAAPKILLFYNKQHAAVDMTASHSSLPFSHMVTKSKDCIEVKSFQSIHKPNPSPIECHPWISNTELNFQTEYVQDLLSFIARWEPLSIYPWEWYLSGKRDVDHLSFSAKTMDDYCYAYSHQDP